MRTKTSDNFPPEWQKLLAEHEADIRAGKLVLFDKELELAKPRTLSIVLPIPEGVGDEIDSYLRKSLASWQEAMIFQPKGGYHFTIQWLPAIEAERINRLEFVRKVQKILMGLQPVRGKLVFPFFGRAGWFGLVEDSGYMIEKMRLALRSLWKEEQLTEGLREADFKLLYTSLIRYEKSFSQEEIEKMRQVEQRVTEVVLNEVRVVLNDKFMSPERTEILGRFTLQ